MNELKADLASGLQEILISDDLFHRAGGIASWTQMATYIFQPACPLVPSANHVRLVNIPADQTPQIFLQEAEEVFRDHGLPYLEIRLDGRSQPAGMGEFLIEQGFFPQKDTVYQVLETGEVPDHPVSILNAQEEGVLADLETILQKWDQACLDESCFKEAVEVRQFRREAGVLQEFVAYYQGEPACTVGVVKKDSVARIKDLFVDPEYLPTGIGSGVMGAILSDLFDRGITGVGIFGEDVAGLNGLIREFGFSALGEVTRYRRTL